MSFWKYLGEFLLFRWLFGKRNSNHNTGSTYRTDTNGFLDWGYDEDIDFNTINHQQDSNSLLRGADIYDEEDDALDDYDPTDSNSYQSNSYTKYDHRDYGYSQSYDDFHEEQDDHDMMDDDF